MRTHWVVVALALASCTTLRPGTDRADGAPSSDTLTGDGPVGDACWNPSGFGGRGCWSCAPTTREQLLNACTTAQCEQYDNGRLPLDGGGLPQLPARDGGADTVTTDTGSVTDAQSSDTGPTIPACSSLPGSVVYATGSSAVTLFLGFVAQALANAPSPVTVVYKSQGSCVGVSALVTPASAMMTGSGVYWDPNPAVDPTSAAAQLPCSLDSAGVAADVGLSDVFATTCLMLPSGLDPSIRDTFGPVQIMNFAVPQNSTAHAISAEAAFLVYGFGAAGYQVDPWLDPLSILARNSNSGTQALIAATIGLAKDRWAGVSNAGSSNVRDALKAAAMAGQPGASRAIGILSADILAPETTLRGLAYQDFRQSCAFWPGSQEVSKDMRNVRDGHYPMFGPLHMLSRVTGAGVPANPNAQRLLDAISGVTPLANLDIINVYASKGLIPGCAMRVTRQADGGDIRPFSPPSSCGCYFEERATGLNPPPGCTPCDRGSDCPAAAPNCNRFATQARGYCEP